MNDRIHYTHCPVCGAASLKDVLIARDYTVSKQDFTITECAVCSVRFTQDVPTADAISPYYKSEDYISHTNTSKGLINSLYQFVRKITIKNKIKLVKKVTGLSKGNLLDVGSGTGTFANAIKQAGWQVTGLEPDQGARAVALEQYNLELVETGQLVHLTNESYDAITMWHVLEHVHALDQYMQQMKQLLTPNGRLIIAVPNYMAKDAAIYEACWAAYDVPRHLYHFSPTAMKTLVEKHGMKLEQCKPMWYDSFYISMLSSKYRNNKPNLAGAFFSGLRSNLSAIGNAGKCSSVIYIIRK